MNGEDFTPLPNDLSGVRSIQTIHRLFALGAFVIFSMLAAGTLVLFDARQDAWRAAELSSSNLIGSIERDITHVISVYDRSLQGVVRAIEEPGGGNISPAALQTNLSERAAIAEYSGRMLVADAKGHVVASSLSHDLELDIADYDYFQAHRDSVSAGLFLSRPFRTGKDGCDVRMALSRRINKPDGTFGGVAVGSLRFAYFDEMFSSLDLGPSGTAFIMRDDSRLIARFPQLGVTLDPEMSDSPVWLGMRSSESGQFIATSKVDGIRRLFAFRRVNDLPLRVTVAVSVDEVLAAWWRKAMVMSTILVILSGATMALCLLFQREMTRRFTAEQQLVKAAGHLSIAASTDELTGLANRRAYQAQLAVAWRRAVRDQTSIALLVADADCFKNFNDHYGHQAGDVVLKGIASCLDLHTRRPGDLAVRHGGEEFVAILPSIDAEGAVSLAERVRKAVAALDIAHRGSPSGRVTVSIGVALMWPRPGDSENNLFKAADEALYIAKGAGRDRVMLAGVAAPLVSLGWESSWMVSDPASATATPLLGVDTET